MARERENPAVKGGKSGGQRASQPGYGDVSAAEVERFIAGIDFPCDKQELIDYARQNDAPDEVLDLMEEFPEQEYGSAVDVARGVSSARQH